MTANLGHLTKPGTLLANSKYRVDRVLGQGAFGVVVAATHIELEEPVAIKFLIQQDLNDTESLERFKREAKIALRLRSQHTVKILDADRLDNGNGIPFLVMEYLEGIDFNKYLEQRRSLPVDEAARYLIQACEAVQEAHEKGIVHRDLKPANMLLTKGVSGAPWVKILDFGIAKLAPPNAPNQPGLTQTIATMGSPSFMSPEQINSTKNVDPRTDIWALGVIFYFFVTGQYPFQAETQGALFGAILYKPPTPPNTFKPGLSQNAVEVIYRCLEKDPNKRFQSAAELAEALKPLAVPNARPSQPSYRGPHETALLPTLDRRSSNPGPPPFAGQPLPAPPAVFDRVSTPGTIIAQGQTGFAPGPAAWPAQGAAAPPNAQPSSAPQLRRNNPMIIGVIGGAVALVLVAGIVLIVGWIGGGEPTAPTASASQSALPETTKPVATQTGDRPESSAPNITPSAAPSSPAVKSTLPGSARTNPNPTAKTTATPTATSVSPPQPTSTSSSNPFGGPGGLAN